jgi:hypothetical protein
MPWKIGLEKLKTFPPKTLGGDLAHFLENEGLSLMPKFESHDIYHVLLKYKTTVVDEARMQFFLLGNRKYSLYIIGTNLIALIFYPEQIRSFINEFQKGRKAISIAKWNFEFLIGAFEKKRSNLSSSKKLNYFAASGRGITNILLQRFHSPDASIGEFFLIKNKKI